MERRLFFYILIYFLFTIPFQSIADQGDSLKIAELNTHGRQLATRLGDFDGAVNTFLEILEIDSNNVAARNNLGTVYKLLGRYNDALTVYNEASGLVVKGCGPDCDNLAFIYMNIGNIYNIKQDYELALQYFNYAERIVNVNSLTSNNATSVYNNIGNVYFYMKHWREALESYKKGVEVKKQFHAGGLDISYANIASTYENLNILDSAKMYYALSIKSKIDQYGPESFYLISVYNNYGVLLQKLGENDDSREYLNKALELARMNYPAKHPVTAECHRYLGSWYLSMNQAEKALEHFHKAIMTVVFNFDNEDIYENPSLESEILSDAVLLEAIRGKAIALSGIYKQKQETAILIASLNTLEKSNLLTEKMRSAYLSQESKLFIAESSHAGYSMAINTAYDLYKLTGKVEFANKAFVYAEKSKSSVLLASLQEVENKKNLGISASLQTFEEELKNETEVYKKKLYEERQREHPDSVRLGIWQGKLINLSKQLDSLNNVIHINFPEYASKFDNEVVDLEGVKEGLLEEGQVLVEYAFTDTLMFIFLLCSDSHYIARVPINADFYSDIEILSQFLRNNDFANNTFEDFQAYTDAAYSLYKTLFQAVEDRIAGKKLIIIPDGELGYIPFEALLTSDVSDGGMDYRSLPYLIYKFSTNYSYSATLLVAEKAVDETSGNQVLAFAPTYDNLDGIKGDKFPAYRDYLNYLVPLRFTTEEIENISSIMNCTRYESYDATEKVFRELAPDYDILHLAMHTLINDENPMYSQLVFTLNNDTLEDNDGLLNTYELFNIKLSARMAVLSACNTGYGKLRKGEGIMSLARGFIFAGVPSIIMTLWAVEDQSGSILMSKFYENLVDGQNIDAALRQAKLQYLQNADQLGAHPYLWSGYVSIGSTTPLVITSYYLWYIFGVGLLLVALLIFVKTKQARRKQRA